MSEEKTKKWRPSLGTSDKVILGVLGVLILLIIALSVLQRFGLMPVNGAVALYLPMLALLVLVVWGVYALVRKIKNRTVKLLVGGGLAMVLLLVLVVAYTYASYLAFYAMPQRYSTITSPSGKRKLVVMRGFDTDDERQAQRKAARLEANPEDTEEDRIEDWGYVYRAYPQALGLFYRSDTDVEGEIYLAITDIVSQSEFESASETATEPQGETVRGTMMVEWLDDEATAHFFVENPGVAEGGDCYVRF